MTFQSFFSKRSELALNAFGAASLLFLCALLFKYLAFQSRQNFTSDDAVLNLLAREVYQHGRLFPENWVTANGDLMLPSGTLIIAPLLHFFPNSFELHAVVSVILTGVFLFSVHWTLKTHSHNSYFLPMALFASGISFKYTQMVLLQTTYFWWVCAFFLTIAVFAKNRFTRPRSREILLAVLISAAVSLSNPSRSMLMYALPALAFLAAYHWRIPFTAPTLAPAAWRIGAVLIGWLIASAIYYNSFRFGFSKTVDHASALQLANIKQIHSNFSIFLNGWVEYLGLDPAAFSGTALAGLYLAISGSLVVLFSVAAFIWWIGEDSTEDTQFDFYRAMGIAFIASFIPVIVLYVFFVPLAVNPWTTRYFTTPVSILFLVSSICIGNWFSNKRRLDLLLIAFLLTCICWISYIRYKVQAAASITETNTIRVARELIKLNTSKGYATYWNASSVTILTSEAVKVRPIEIASNTFRPYPVMISHDWYRQEAGPSFLLLTDGEATAFRAFIEGQFGRAKKIIPSNGYQIWIYERDLAEKMSKLQSH
ncbi:MAG: hypothetical protein IV088_10260 [Hydrogenophaga sp.]|uniref:hypothetical protein n=1 Tax=Hydrogenophaga sp. TaxID=1904254 RepID=UPI0025C324C5|nr:hypothetical protein [Hydrogenophaga sp.]MBT9551220.1 hypothetical protein [Hydrogenophaga sp.]